MKYLGSIHCISTPSLHLVSRLNIYVFLCILPAQFTDVNYREMMTYVFIQNARFDKVFMNVRYTYNIINKRR